MIRRKILAPVSIAAIAVFGVAACSTDADAQPKETTTVVTESQKPDNDTVTVEEFAVVQVPNMIALGEVMKETHTTTDPDVLQEQCADWSEPFNALDEGPVYPEAPVTWESFIGNVDLMLISCEIGDWEMFTDARENAVNDLSTLERSFAENS